MNIIASINLGNRGSTGKIMRSVSALAEKSGYMAYQIYPGNRINLPPNGRDIVLCNFVTFKLNRELAKYTGYIGCFAPITTFRLLWKLNKIKPDVIHFHNLHNSYINLPMLFRYVKKHHIRVIWTLHDCWPFTGRCPYFDMTKCDKWQTGCGDCPYPKESYPQALVDKTAKMWKHKKKWFTGIENMTIVTPSRWLADLVKESFLKDYPVKVIHNGIDLSVFKPTESNFRQKHGTGGKYMLLGVADSWGERKGLDVFIELSKRLDNAKYQIVLVGTNDSVDEQLPDNIISVHRTQDQKELAEIYTAADLFVNPTREENYPTVNMESIACGTPVLTFRTGGSPEIPDETCGSVVDCDDIDAMENEIKSICDNKRFMRDDCMGRAKMFDKDEKYKEYLKLYKNSGGGYRVIRIIRITKCTHIDSYHMSPDHVYGKAC